MGWSRTCIQRQTTQSSSLRDWQRPTVVEERLEGVRELRLPQRWGALAMVVAVCLILGRVFGVSLLKGAAKIGKSPAVSEPAVQAAVQPPVQAAVRVAVQSSVPIARPTVSAVEKAEPRALLPEPTLVARKPAPPPVHLTESIVDPEPAALPVESPTVALAGASPRAFVTALPQGHLVQPVLSDPNLAGEVQLRAFINADGSVKEVALVSGNPKLAEAGMAAVRRWHYAQNQASGPDGEREALIRMNFFGQDAVSITSVAR